MRAAPSRAKTYAPKTQFNRRDDDMHFDRNSDLDSYVEDYLNDYERRLAGQAPRSQRFHRAHRKEHRTHQRHHNKLDAEYAFKLYERFRLNPTAPECHPYRLREQRISERQEFSETRYTVKEHACAVLPRKNLQFCPSFRSIKPKTFGTC